MVPVTLDVTAVERSLAVAGINRFGRLRYETETESTNDDAAALLGEPGSGGLVIVAEFQRGGHGRRGRDWIAPAGSSLLFTTIIPGAVTAAALWAVPYWTALCVADGIERASGLRVGLQWPNDVLLAGKKCGGILCISRVAGNDAHVASGVGLNVFRPPREVEGIDPPPAFLSDRLPSIAREAILLAIITAYNARLPLLAEPRKVARLWEARAELDGTPYRVTLDSTGETFEGVAHGLADEGSLLVNVNGELRDVALGDARVLRS